MEQYSQEQRAVEKLSTQLLENVGPVHPVLLVWGMVSLVPVEKGMLLHRMPNRDT